MVAEPPRPDGESLCFDAAAQEFRRKNVGIGITPTCGMDRCDVCRVRLGSRSDNDVVQVMLSRFASGLTKFPDQT